VSNFAGPLEPASPDFAYEGQSRKQGQKKERNSIATKLQMVRARKIPRRESDRDMSGMLLEHQEETLGKFALTELQLCQSPLLFGGVLKISMASPCESMVCHELNSRPHKESCDIPERQFPTVIKAEEITPLDSLFSQSLSDLFTVPEQLKLALKMVNAVLQYHATPWLEEWWTVRDISFFSHQDTHSPLDSLHVGTNFSVRGLHGNGDLSRKSTFHTSEAEESMLLYNIKNLTLYSLGVALLQVGRWVHLDPNDVLRVRRLARLPSRLGKRYDEIVRKCLECNFGPEVDLAQTHLQEVIHQDVVSSLEGMIEKLEIGSS
jgi:hypothetical protein